MKLDSELNSCTVHDYLADYDTSEAKTWGKKDIIDNHKYPVIEFSFKLKDNYRT